MHLRSYMFLLVVTVCALRAFQCQPQEPSYGPEEARLRELSAVSSESLELAPRCDDGEAAACFALANHWIDGDRGFGPDHERARELAERGCNTPGADSCVLFAKLSDPWGVWAYPANESGSTDQLRTEIPRILNAG